MVKLERHERFKDARTVHNRHGWQSMDEVAVATALSKNMISRLESEKYQGDAGYKSVAVLAQHYGVSIDWLLGLTEDPRPKRAAVDELGLTPKAVEWLCELRNSSEPDEYGHIYRDGLLHSANILFENVKFQALVRALCNLVDAVEAERLFYTTPYGMDLPERIQGIKDGGQYSASVVSYLNAQNLVAGQQIPEAITEAFDFGFNITDILINDVNLSVSRLVDNLRERGKT